MKAKLIKKGEEYHLWVNHIEPKIVPFAKYPWDITKQRLSLKNCQAIELGYDLEDLAEEKYPIFNLGLNATTSIHTLHQESFKEGFQKALELMGDKKYSEEDIKKMMKSASYGWFEADFDKHLATLQQDIWDVEIIEECLDKDCDGVDRKGDCITTGKPKLDAEGCLILKRI